MPDFDPAPTVEPARYAHGKMLAICPSNGSGIKTRAMRLAEHFGGRWTNRSRGYVMSPAAAVKFLAAYARGCDAHIRIFADQPKLALIEPGKETPMTQTNQTPELSVEGDLRAALSALWDIKGKAETERQRAPDHIAQAFWGAFVELCDCGLSGSSQPKGALTRPENRAAQALDVMLGLGSWRR